MKQIVNVTTGILTVFFVGATVVSCKDKAQKDDSHEGHQNEAMHHEGSADGSMQDHSQMDHGTMNHGTQAKGSSAIVADYLALKNALVSDDEKAAAQAGAKLEGSLKQFDAGNFAEAQQTELREILEDATEHAEHISRSEMAHQREHFEGLSKDFIDLLAITGSGQTLYVAYCPMYNNNKGGQWLSASEEIRNPYFGSAMLNCGTVQKEIN